jgi:hypothetical protein
MPVNAAHMDGCLAQVDRGSWSEGRSAAGLQSVLLVWERSGKGMGRRGEGGAREKGLMQQGPSDVLFLCRSRTHC